MTKFNGKLIILSAPSGSGKTTLVKHILSRRTDISFSISCTTRKIRKGETNEKDYYFLSKEDFLHKINNGEFAEYEEVYQDIFYGTLDAEIKRNWLNNKHVIFDVDVLGGIALKKKYPLNSLSVFVMAPNKETIKLRLIGRGTEGEENINQRLEKVEIEMNYANRFDCILVNDDLEIAKCKISKLVDDFLQDNTNP